MLVRYRLSKEDEYVEIEPEGSTVMDLLACVGVPPDSVIVLEGDDIVPVDADLVAGGCYTLQTVLSGG